ncbi:15094_t:CDS:2, partial [Acaulospora colombiana]
GRGLAWASHTGDQSVPEGQATANQSVGAKHSQRDSPACIIPKGVVSKLAVSRARIGPSSFHRMMQTRRYHSRADLDTQNGERNEQEITNDTHMLVGELGMLLGLLLPNRVTPLGDKLRAAGVNPEGRPARLLLPSVSPGDPALEDLSAFDVAAAWRDGFVGFLCGTAGGEALTVTAALDEGDWLGEGKMVGGGVVAFVGELDIVDIVFSFGERCVLVADVQRKGGSGQSPKSECAN